MTDLRNRQPHIRIPRIRRLLVWLLALTLLAVLLLALSTVSLRPAVPASAALSSTDIRRIEQIIVDNSPVRFSSRGERQLSLDAGELNLLTAFVMANVPRTQDVTARFSLEDDTAQAWVSIPQQLGPLTLYLNLHARFAQDQGRARLISLHAGFLPVPRRIMRGAENLVGDRLETASVASQELAELRHGISSVELRDDLLHLTLQWKPEALEQLRAQARQIFMSEDDRQRLLSYYIYIGDIAREVAQQGRTVSMQAFLPDLFARASERSADSSAIAENRSLLQALSLYVNNLSIGELLDGIPDDSVFSPPALRVTLYQRQDLGRHFTSAAAIAASAGAGIAEVLANSKEVYDARYTSGFSFSDMTANVAGLALGETATRTEAQARALQLRLRDVSAESGYMPAPDTEGDGMTEEAFIERYRDRNSPTYLARLRSIEAKVAELPLYAAPEPSTP
ncbi:hypothetical protein [Pseudohongiella sp.]|uniref:Uncharacterized protein n=1 Tax=marine sediment metagenome TaxID=412755 RepID=A0A0F9VMS7_9ZZZZ|nr:hypothetical protein [Pseudohongiella sp.]HDZ10470.1 hypothetical protein [Pseudohongiella sp.]HEA62193.1 hypothetical protein [Pseudohongiella sp.]